MTSSDTVVEGANRLRYRLLTGADDREFCERVSQALDEGYRLYGNPVVAVNGEETVVAQAVVLGVTDPSTRP